MSLSFQVDINTKSSKLSVWIRERSAAENWSVEFTRTSYDNLTNSLKVAVPWKRISRKQSAKWQHLSWLKASAMDIESLQNILLKVCYVPATSAGLNRLLFFAAAINSTNEANKEGSMCH